MNGSAKKLACLVTTVLLVTVILAAVCLNADAMKSVQPENNSLEAMGQAAVQGMAVRDDGGDLIYPEDLMSAIFTAATALNLKGITAACVFQHLTLI